MFQRFSQDFALLYPIYLGWQKLNYLQLLALGTKLAPCFDQGILSNQLEGYFDQYCGIVVLRFILNLTHSFILFFDGVICKLNGLLYSTSEFYFQGSQAICLFHAIASLYPSL